MPKVTSKSKYWGRPKKAPDHPYVAYEGTPLWHIVKKAIADLEKNDDLAISEWHQYIVGYVCQRLDQGKAITVASKRRKA